MLKNTNGITLVALVVTIVILLILSGVSLNLVLGNQGLITKANAGRSNYTNASLEEQKLLNSLADALDAYASGQPNQGETDPEEVLDPDGWDFAYVCNSGTWSNTKYEDNTQTLTGDIIAKFYKTGRKIDPPQTIIQMNDGYIIDPGLGDELKVVVEGSGSMGPLFAGTNSSVKAWKSADFPYMMSGAGTPISPYISEVKISSGITNIGAFSFLGASMLTKVEMPNTIQSIDNYAFDTCVNLTDINMSTSILTIGQCAFRSCSNLQNINLPNGLTEVGNYSFNNCVTLQNVTIPATMTTIGNAAFNGCDSLEKVKILVTSNLTVGTFPFLGSNISTFVIYVLNNDIKNLLDSDLYEVQIVTAQEMETL